ncbi:Cytochrome P450, partial [Apiospora sp. TS-2023a]
RFLLFKYPILSYGDAENKPILICPYEFPNRQGNITKFLEGEKKSKEWIREVLTRLEDVKTVFRDFDSYFKAKNNDAGWLMGEFFGKCLGLVIGFEWRQTRFCMGDLFTQLKVAA